MKQSWTEKFEENNQNAKDKLIGVEIIMETKIFECRVYT